jgi:hypothetical protein
MCKENSRAFKNLGRFYIVSPIGNTVMQEDLDLEKLARQIGCLQPYESLLGE